MILELPLGTYLTPDSRLWLLSNDSPSYRRHVSSISRLFHSQRKQSTKLLLHLLILCFAIDELVDHQTALMKNEGQVRRAIVFVHHDVGEASSREHIGQICHPSWLQAWVLHRKKLEHFAQAVCLRLRFCFIDPHRSKVRITPLQISARLFIIILLASILSILVAFPSARGQQGHILSILKSLSTTRGTWSTNKTKAKKRTWTMSKTPTRSSGKSVFTSQ